MRVLIAAGGTGGHVIPALQVAAELRGRGADVLFVGTARGLEARIVPERGFPLKTIDIGGLNRVSLQQIAATLIRLPGAFLNSADIINRYRPDVTYGVGAYVSGPVLLMAASQSISIVVHEANAVPGFANRLLAPLVYRALLADEAASRFFPSTRISITGLPVQDAFFRIPRKTHAAPYTVLITGGSLGSARLNRAVLDLPEIPGVHIIHQTGAREYEVVKAASKHETSAFINDMPAAMSRADVVVSRAGASTLAELAAAGKAALLVPFPYASDDHQLHNALARESAGAARVVRDAELTGDRLAREIQAMLPHLDAMEESVRRFAVPDATIRIADAIEDAAA